MKLALIAATLAVVSTANAQPTRHGTPLQLWYRQPAAQWNAALPIGNGTLGAMVFGGANTGSNNGDSQDQKVNADIADGSHTRAQDEHLQLNESSVWAGDRSDRLNPKAGAAFPEIRKLLAAGKVTEAEALAKEAFISTPRAMPGYETLGDLYLRSTSAAPVTDYRRQLDISTGVVRITYTQSGVHFTREIFASAPAHLIAIRLTADRPGGLSLSASMDRPAGTDGPADFSTRTVGSNRLQLLPGPGHKEQIRFAAELLALPTAGTVTADAKQLTIANADSVTLLLTAATDFKQPDPIATCEHALAAASTQPFAAMEAAVATDLQQYMQQSWLQLGADVDPLLDTPTDERLALVSAGKTDLHLEMIYFQLARYLLIQSSRPGGMAANLQGLWASGISNPWGSKFTVNINTEMNYWAADATGLGPMNTPLFDLIDTVRNPATGTGQLVAKKYYGANGFVLHHNTDIWGDANPADGVPSGIWPMAGAWLSLHLWDHYAYTGDEAFLKQRAYPALHDAAQFFLDYLTDDGHGHLVTGPSLSPENKYLLPDGSAHSLVMGPTMDIEITRELFTRAILASDLLHEDPVFRTRLIEARAKLLPFKVGKFGNIQEWPQDYAEATPGHRHISHLWALYPGSQISPEHTPELANAARTTLQRRLDNGGGQTGWSRAWVINYWDRLRDGNQAYDSLKVLLRQSTFPNLLDDHPPGVFQIDGNEGAAAGMVGMVLDSHLEPTKEIKLDNKTPTVLRSEIDLLPALPDDWPDGWFQGFHARGGETVTLGWASGRAVTAIIRSSAAGLLTLRSPTREIGSIRTEGVAIKLHRDFDGAVSFTMQPATSYTVTFR